MGHEMLRSAAQHWIGMKLSDQATGLDPQRDGFSSGIEDRSSASTTMIHDEMAPSTEDHPHRLHR